LLLASSVFGGGPIACSREAARPPVQPAVSSAPQPSTIPQADRPPAALGQIGESAQILFDAAFASDWSAANEQVQALTESVASLPQKLPKPDIVEQLRSRLNWLPEHVTAKDRVGTMEDANAITLFAADISAEFQTDVPYEAVMLGYYGRQLELGIAANRPATLTQASTDLRSTWTRIEPAIQRRGDLEDAKRFNDIVVQLDGARRPSEFVAPTRAELTEADRITKLFQSPT
jgi:hypothetical protein